MWKFAGGTLARAARSLRRRHAETASGTFIVDRHGNVLGFDDAMEELTGWPAVEVVGQHKDRLRQGAWSGRGGTGSLYEGSLAEVAEVEIGELRLRCRDGSTLLTEVRFSRLPGRGERLAVRVLSVLSREAPRIPGRRQDGRDPLTGLLDARSFATRLVEQLEAGVREGRTLALLLADVDQLRSINDRLGHDAGDRVLCDIAGIIGATVGEEAVVARLVADDFAILLPGIGRGEARQAAARLRSAAERFRFHEDGTPATNVTLSIGSASYPADADSGADLMRRAEDALDQARAFGRNRAWCYTRRPRVPLEVPVYFDTAESLLVGFTRDLSPSGVFVQTASPVEMGMRCALTFGLPTEDDRIHVVGRVVRTVPPSCESADEPRIPGMGIEFERFGADDRRAIEGYLHRFESLTRRPETGIQSTR